MEVHKTDSETPEWEEALLQPLEYAEKNAKRATGWWWLYVLLGLASIALGAAALGSRIGALSTLVAVFAVFLLYTGAVELVLGFTSRRVAWLAIVTGAISIAAGILALVWPGITLYVLAVIVGASLLGWGIYRIYLAFADPVIKPRAITLVEGLALTALGVLALAWPHVSIVVLAVLVGVFFVVFGVFSFVAGLRLLDLHHELKHAEAKREKAEKDLAHTKDSAHAA